MPAETDREGQGEMGARVLSLQQVQLRRQGRRPERQEGEAGQVPEVLPHGHEATGATEEASEAVNAYELPAGKVMRAHDVRRLGICEHCGEKGFDLPITEAKFDKRGKRMLEASHGHGRCILEKHGKKGYRSLLCLPTTELAKVVLEDVGPDVMREIVEESETRERLVRETRLSRRQVDFLRYLAIDGHMRWIWLRHDPAHDPGALDIQEAFRSGGARYTGAWRTARSLRDTGLTSWLLVKGGNRWSLSLDGWRVLSALDARRP